VTEYEYDDAGRLVRAVTTRTPEWDEESRAEVIAWLDYEAQQCPGCGGYLPDTTAPDAVYSAGLPHRCKRCDAIRARQEEYTESIRPDALVVWPTEPPA
jgi:hypothetical protein